MNAPLSDEARQVVDFWVQAGPGAWFRKSPAFDAAFRERFLALHERAAGGELQEWARSAEGAFALLILLDQFPRNAFRDTPRMYATDEQALGLARDMVARGLDRQIPEDRRGFVYLPFSHSEDLRDQDECVRLNQALGGSWLSFAVQHQDVIARFGRFPHRNPILGRRTTPEEAEFLRKGGFAG